MPSAPELLPRASHAPEAAAADVPTRAETPAHAGAPPRNRRRAIGLGVAAAVVLAGLGYWYHGTFYEDTDDAQVDGYICNIAPRVSGTVVAVHVDDNQNVASGAALVDLDPADYKVARDQAKAALAQAEAQLRIEQPGVAITETSNATLVSTSTSDVASGRASLAEAQRALAQAEAQLAQAQANDKLAQIDLKRAEDLYRTGAIAKAEYDARESAANASTAGVAALVENVEAARRRIDDQSAKVNAAMSRQMEAKSNAPQTLETKRASVEWRQASVDAAKSQLDQAELNLAYTHITAPAAGIIGKRSVNLGDRVSPGQQLFALTQTDTLWVTANFRETQVRKMHPGQHAKVYVDALDRDFEGEVESIAAATGSRYSVLPPENATGNYVKVVQRLPVRIRLLPGQQGLERLRPGMSVEPQVRIK